MSKKEPKLLTFEEIQAQLKGTQSFHVNPKFGYAVVSMDTDDRTHRLFVVRGDKFEEIDVKQMVRIIAKYLAKHVTIEKLLADKLLHKPVETLLRLQKRVEKKGEVTEHKGCYYLEVGGSRGPKIQLDL
jgi:hypothetical protein